MSGDESEEGEEGFYSREICNNLLHVSRDIGSGKRDKLVGPCQSYLPKGVCSLLTVLFCYV